MSDKKNSERKIILLKNTEYSEKNVARSYDEQTEGMLKLEIMFRGNNTSRDEANDFIREVEKMCINLTLKSSGVEPLQFEPKQEDSH